MRIIVLGSGVIGVTTAYYLAQAGHEVIVVDRHPAPALGTSFANAGQISPGYASPWARPGVLRKALSWLLRKHAPLHIVPDGSLFQLRWLYQMVQNASADRYSINKLRMVRLAEYSRDCLDLLRDKTNIQYEGREKGTLQIFRTPQQLAYAQQDMSVLKELNVPYEFFASPDEIARIEPALATDKCIGGLRLPDDETGDCKLFTEQLVKMAETLGVQFRFNTVIDRLITTAHQIEGVQCGEEVLRADAYVVALGAESTLMLGEMLPLPVYPVKGYSITVPIVNEAASPLSTILDETHKVAITRFDSRIRVGGIAEFSGFSHTLNPKRRETLAMVLNDLFPGAGDVSQASFWTGLRAMTPDGTPIVSETKWPNLFINTGHGTLGWTMACGSAQLLLSIISKQPTPLNLNDYSINRYQLK